MPANILCKKPLSIDLQMKCTSKPEYDGSKEHILFSMDSDLFRTMHEPGSTPMLLFLHILPESPEEWVVQDNKKIILKETTFWYSAINQNEPPSDNKSIRIKIPVNNMVTKDSLYQMFCKVSRKEDIINED
jgi:hypothetical protein